MACVSDRLQLRFRRPVMPTPIEAARTQRWRSRRSILFIGTPRIVFNPAVHKKNVQDGSGSLSKQFSILSRVIVGRRAAYSDPSSVAVTEMRGGSCGTFTGISSSGRSWFF